jgi:hypothetical protein
MLAHLVFYLLQFSSNLIACNLVLSLLFVKTNLLITKKFFYLMAWLAFQILSFHNQISFMHLWLALLLVLESRAEVFLG